MAHAHAYLLCGPSLLNKGSAAPSILVPHMAGLPLMLYARHIPNAGCLALLVKNAK
jgi:hypothetical protein